MDTKEYISSGIIEAYVMGLASEEEVSILMCIRQHNTEVEQAILEAEMTLEDLATRQAMSPPPELKAAIWNTLSQQETTSSSPLEPQQQDLASIKPMASPSSAAERPVRTLSARNWAIAASILLVASIGANIFYHNQSVNDQDMLVQALVENQSTEQKLQHIQEKWKLLQDPVIKTVTLAGVEQHPQLKAHVFWNTKTTDVYLSLENLPAAPKGKQYQLWAIVDGKPVDAGVLPLDKTDQVTIMHQIPAAQAFAITLETIGGNPTPDLTQLYVMGNT
ncbi:anti-sigma factor [Sphingobacterium faecium]|uniref:anti-sigma factor n=1 Tax=Sphingobacterium faecium TaxID=34087 RepID=UPI00320945FC